MTDHNTKIHGVDCSNLKSSTKLTSKQKFGDDIFKTHYKILLEIWFVTNLMLRELIV